MADLPAQPNQSLILGLACLEAVVTAESPLGSRELARQLGLEHTRISRLLGTLCHLGLIQRTPARKYRPGPGIHVLSAQSLRGSGLLATSLPLLKPLLRERLTVSLGVLWKHQVCYLVYASPGVPLERALGAHGAYPVHESILGRALLARRSDAEVRRLLGTAPVRLDRAELGRFLGELRPVRRHGFALRRLENGQTSIGAVIGEPPLGALALTGTIAAARESRLVRLLLDTAARITAALTGKS